MDELQKKLRETLEKISALNGLGDKMTDDDAERLDGLNKDAVKLQARIDAEELSAQHAKDEEARIEREKQAAVKAALNEQKQKFDAERNRLPIYDGMPHVAQYADTYKYDQLSASELALAVDMGRSMGVKFGPGAAKALSLRVAELDPKAAKSDEERKAVSYVKGAFKAATNIEPDMAGVEAAIKAATDPMYTGASPMSDWVGTAYSQEIWRKIRGAVAVAQKIPTDVVPDGYSSKYWPLESTDFTWYKAAEASSSNATLKEPQATVAVSQVATSSKQITIGKMGARGLWTQEATEDSLVRYAPQMSEQLMKSGAEYLEHVLIDGDVETSANKNINDIAGTPAGTEPFLILDGFRKLALVTNTANSRSASGGFVVEDYKDTLMLLGTAGLAGSDPTKVGFIQDFNTMYAAMEIQELKTKDVHSAATIEEGFLRRVYRVPVYDSFFMHFLSAGSGYERKANTSGKVDLDTDSNNTTGSILAVRFDQWKIAYKRRMTIEVTRKPEWDGWDIVAWLRFGMAYRDNEASAITYYVGV